MIELARSTTRKNATNGHELGIVSFIQGISSCVCGIGWNLAIGIALSFSYILFLRFGQMFVYTGTLSPGVALWLPNMLYALIAAFLYKIAPK